MGQLFSLYKRDLLRETCQKTGLLLIRTVLVTIVRIEKELYLLYDIMYHNHIVF